MKKNSLIVLVTTLFVLLIVAFAYRLYFENIRALDSTKTIPIGETEKTFDPRNTTITLEDGQVVLVNGESIVSVPDSAMKVITKYFGNEAKGDLNNDGKNDVAYIVNQEQGGSGSMYYIVIALSSGNELINQKAIFLGDRIAPQTTEIKTSIDSVTKKHKTVLYVNYADRGEQEPMSASPSIGVTKIFEVGIDGSIVEVGQ